MPPFLTDEMVRAGMPWLFIGVGFLALWWAWRGWRDGAVINPPDYPGDRESFDRGRETFLYWLNMSVCLVAGVAGLAMGSKGLRLW